MSGKMRTNWFKGEEPYFGFTNDRLCWGVDKFDVEKLIVYYSREDFRILSTSNRIPTRGSTKKGSHVYFLFQLFWVILLFDINVIFTLPWWPDVTTVQSDITIVVLWQLSTGSIHDYLFCYCPLVSILFEVLRVGFILQVITSTVEL